MSEMDETLDDALGEGETLVGESGGRIGSAAVDGPQAVELLSAFLAKNGREAGSEIVHERMEALRETLASVYELFKQQGRSFDDEKLGVNGEESLDDLVLRFLCDAVSRDGRYVVGEELARGGQGIIRSAFDRDLHRTVAIKELRSAGGADATRAHAGTRSLGRFLDEALVTGQLDHPGIVPLHEMGIDVQGRMQFTMKMVRGIDLSEVVTDMREDRSEGALQRVLDIMVKVCDAVGYAHSKGVVHRDLKPSNIRVGRFGEVYVMDWGLARVVGQEGADLRVQLPVEHSGDVQSVRPRISSDTSADSPLVTMDGDVIGTPAFMPPEQALGRLDEIDERSDVYAMGAMLYALLAGHSPYIAHDVQLNHIAVWTKVQDGPPPALSSEAPDASAELVAICEKAMARRKEDRYRTAADLAADLRAYLGGRVVHAYRTGAFAELNKWVARNKGVAASLAALFFVVVLAGGIFSFQQSARAADAERANLTKRQLLDEALAKSLILDMDEIYPIHPDTIPKIEEWLESAHDLVSREAVYAEQLEQMETRAVSSGVATKRPAPKLHPRFVDLLGERRLLLDLSNELKDATTNLNIDPRHADWLETQRILEPLVEPLKAKIAGLEEQVLDWMHWDISDAAIELAHSKLFGLVRGIRELKASYGGIGAMEIRLRRAQEMSQSSDDEAWAGAIEDIESNPIYSGLKLKKQTGLLPLGPGMQSGLWEFLVTVSGERPRYDDWGKMAVSAETGIVLILVPGGEATIGCQSEDPSGLNFAATGIDQEYPVRQLTLAPYFLSKYEMTQAQWTRAAGNNPSRHAASQFISEGLRVSQIHPVEQVTWIACVEVLERLGLCLPTQAQMEHATRGQGEPIVLPAELVKRRCVFFPGSDWSGGVEMHAPVDTFEPNTFGFYHLAGNVWEWCADWYYGSYSSVDFRAGTGLMLLEGEAIFEHRRIKTQRGGGFKNDASMLRASYRHARVPWSNDDDLGVRPSRMLDE